ncbi:M56 and MltD domain-containing protein [Corallococcus aberystwythensis]|uniref:Tail length tape measure protein n=1 Tax=Corallococcus aberystwythensis TaxID=2316722 RepID=A0A3A8R4Z6_9BACT|nr:M56 and MltD domain-containing protein [Corallococcus aberystwythensis]RKH70444.1 tail length tape measure protein [Corallococcus aberystwythensis]
MSATFRDVLAAYLTAAALVAVGFGLLRAVLALGMERRLAARQTLRVGRVTLGLAVLLPFVALAVREWMPSAPLFTVERSLMSYAAPLAPVEARPVRGAVPGAPASDTGLPGALLGMGLLGVGALGGLAWNLRRYARLWRKLESLPVLRRVGRVRVVLGDAEEGAFSVWFPGGGAWVVVPAAVLEDAEALRLTVRHELQHHRQRDTVLAYARLGFDSAFFWNPFARAFSRWLAERQELACDEALVTVKHVSADAYARCLLQASLRVPGSFSLPAGVTGMSHPTVRRIHMLFQPRPRSSVRTLGLSLSLALVLAPLALWAQGTARGRTVSMAEARSLAEAGQKEGNLPVVVDAAVLEQLNKFVTTQKGRDFMRKALANLQSHREAMTGTLRSRSLPEELVAVAMVESAVSNLQETSREPSMAPGQRGAGVWMFIPETARRYGLKVEAGRDERLDVARETEAAAALFQALYARYGDWRLALAAYNQGEGVVDRVIAETGVRDVSELVRTGKLNGYTATVQAGVLLLRNPRLLD